MSSNQIQQVEVSLEQARKVVAFGEAIRRLENNPDFRKVILEGYFKDEAVRLTMLTAEMNLKPEAREAVMHGIRAIAECRQFLQNRVAFSDMAAKEIEDFLEMQVEEDEGDDA